MPPTSLKERCGNAILGLLSAPIADEDPLLARVKEGFVFAPTWGICVSDVATVNWVNRTNAVHKDPYASLTITRTNEGLTPEQLRGTYTTSLDHVAGRARALHPVVDINVKGEEVYSRERITGFANLGLAPEQYGFNHFVFRLAQQ